MGSPDADFDDSIDGLADAATTRWVRIANGAALDLVIGAVRKDLGGAVVKMLAYNGSVPGPALRVRQGTQARITAINRTDVDQTVHWHGLRLDNRFDGVPHETQPPIAPGGRFSYELTFPDAGLYWYHPHFREDYGQEMGLYGCIIVDPIEQGYWPPSDDELVLTIDDVLLEDGRLAPFSRTGPTHTMMGRFGNVMFVAGAATPTFDAQTNRVLRLYLTNTANVRVFNLALEGATMKLIGGDSGRVEHERLVNEVLLAPSERAIVDVTFSDVGQTRLVNRMPDAVELLATFAVAESPIVTPAAGAFAVLRSDESLGAHRAAVGDYRALEPHYTLRLVGSMDMGDMDMDMHDMHVEGADAMASMAGDGGAANPGPSLQEDPLAGVEWQDEMPEMNAMSTNADMTWSLIDVDTGAVNDDISWTLRVGEKVKIRLDNTGGDHLMHHPFHIHGAGRFLVVERGGVEEPNLVWKDTVLVRGGEMVDIILDVTNPGRWMAHCHIAEHAENGMMFNFDVVDVDGSR